MQLRPSLLSKPEDQYCGKKMAPKSFTWSNTHTDYFWYFCTFLVGEEIFISMSLESWAALFLFDS